MDFTLYWFMFPIGIVIATLAMLSGIAGAALFMPIFLLIFPLLGAEYELIHSSAGVAAALLTSTFGFTSGFIAYYRSGLIDFKQAGRFLLYALPFAIIGGIICPMLPDYWIKGVYGLMMVVLAISLFIASSNPQTGKKETFSIATSRTRTSSIGINYKYYLYKANPVLSILGGFLTGLLSTGIGELTVSQLIRKAKFPVPVAAATSVAVVVATFLLAAITHVVNLTTQAGPNAVPWDLVAYTIPGVIIGGQIGPRLQGKIQRKRMVQGMAILFVIIGVSMLLHFFIFISTR